MRIAIRCAVLIVPLVMAALAAAQAGGTGASPPDTGPYTAAPTGDAHLVPSSTPGYFSSAGSTQGCDWSPTFGDAATQNLAFPEANTTYWQASLPQDAPAGATVEIQGQFPNARFFSIGLYNSDYEPISEIYDYQLTPSSGAKPFVSQTQPAAAGRFGQSYNARIVFSTPPASPAPDTLYASSGSSTTGNSSGAGQHLYLLYRVYVPYGSTASGDVSLPALTYQGVPFSQNTQTAACQSVLSQLLQNVLYSISLKSLLAAATPPKAPQFTVYKGGDTPGLNIGLNGANHYMSATLPLPTGYVYLIRGKAPSHTSPATAAAGEAADVRYWSICQNGAASTQVNACVGDFQALVDSGGYYNIVVSNQSAPPYADISRGFNWMPFGPWSRAAVIYRQLLAQPGFAGAIGSAGMGPYTPQIAYCSTAQFESIAAAGTPQQVFQACAAQSQ